MGILRMILAFLRAFFGSRAGLVAENMMLRQQLIVAHRSVPRPKLRRSVQPRAVCRARVLLLHAC